VAITAVENEHVGQFLLHERKFDWSNHDNI
jgi:hypothetical protein